MSDEHDYDAFLSYHAADRTEVERVALRLRDEHGLRSYFDAWELSPSDSVVLSLERSIERSRAVVVLIGPYGTGPWHDEQRMLGYAYALERQRYIIPALLPGASEAEIPGLLRVRAWVELAKDGELDRLAAGIVQGPLVASRRSSTSNGMPN